MTPSLDKPLQKELHGASKARADVVLKIVGEKFNLKTLITEENLKRVGILSERVGSKCDMIKFSNGIPMTSSIAESDDNESDVEANSLKGENHLDAS